MRKLINSLCLLLLATSIMAQEDLTPWQYVKEYGNYISTGMPILSISPDAVSSALGDAGVASEPDANSTHWNNAKYAFAEHKSGISTTYTPWLTNLGVSDMTLLYLSGFMKINDRSAIAASLIYFSLGDIENTNEMGDVLGQFHPNEFSFDLTYAMKLADHLSLGATGRFSRSDLTQGQNIGGTSTKAANALSADVGLYYQTNIDQKNEIAAGLHISNLGSKLRYSDDDTESEFLPANLRLGARYTLRPDEYNKISFLLDANKLLVPTRPIVGEDGEIAFGDVYADMNDYYQTGSIQGAINSFFDAPAGLREELAEFTLSAGAEYWYRETFAGRLGYFFEPDCKGGRQYLTLGLGLRYNILQLDFSYLLPTVAVNKNPLSNTIRISLTVNFGKKKQQ